MTHPMRIQGQDIPRVGVGRGKMYFLFKLLILVLNP